MACAYDPRPCVPALRRRTSRAHRLVHLGRLGPRFARTSRDSEYRPRLPKPTPGTVFVFRPSKFDLSQTTIDLRRSFRLERALLFQALSTSASHGRRFPMRRTSLLVLFLLA